MIKTYKCAMAWANLHITPEGRVPPCMQYSHTENKDLKLYNMTDVSLEEAINSPGLKRVRQSMLAEESNELCAVCDYRETNGMPSTRTAINEELWHRIDTSTTQPDGYLPLKDFKPLMMDVRFSNRCNLKCRMCSHEASSAWYDESIEITDTAKEFIFRSVTRNDSKFIKNDAYEQIEPLLDTLETIYFAGGEPLITPEHYRVLDYIISSGRAKQVSLIYSTNLTVSSYKGKPVRDYWSEFNKVTVAASVDGMDEVAEYVRTNIVWQDNVKVFNELKPPGKEYDHIQIYACITMSLMNVYHLPAFIKWCLENNWIWHGETTYSINYVDYPYDMSVKSLPISARDEVIQLYRDLIEWMKNTGYSAGVNSIEDIIKYISGTDRSDELIKEHNKHLVERFNLYDRTAGLDWRTTMPELEKHLR